MPDDVAGLPAPLAAAGLLRAVRRPLRAARTHLVRHRGDPGRAGRRRRPRWDVTIAGLAAAARRAPCATRAVVVANGHNWSPKLPTYEGLEEFRGKVIHASQYKDAAQLRGQARCSSSAPATPAATSRSRRPSRRPGAGTPPGAATGTRPKYALGRPADQVNDRVLGAAAAAAAAPVAAATHAAAHRRRPDPLRPAGARPPASTRRTRSSTASCRTTSATAGSRRCRTSSGSTAPRSCSPTAARSSRTWSCSPPDTCRASSSSAPELLSIDASGPPAAGAADAFADPSDAGRGGAAAARLGGVHPRALADRADRAVAAAARRRTRPGPPTLWATLRQDGDRRYTAGKVKDSTRHWFEVSHFVYLRELEKTLHELEAVG